MLGPVFSEELEVTRTQSGPSPWLGEHDAPAVQIGAYQILSRLGAGGMGVVFAAYHEGLDRKVALKLVHAGGEGRAQILREAQALARLSHPHVVQVYEVGEHEDQIFIAMEYVRGETLDAWQQAPGRRLGALMEVYRQAALGLQAAHEVGLVHRDFKPSNVIVGADGRVRVIDFGLALPGGGSRPPGGAVDATRAATLGLCAGTPAYMSPEQFAGREVDARSDLFSFCASLWEAVYGERPFAGATFDELAENVAGGRVRAPPRGRELPGRLQEALRRGLAGAPAERGSLEALVKVLGTDPDADPSSAGRARRILFVAFGATLVLVVIPLLVVAAAREGVDRRAIHVVISSFGLVVLGVVGLALRGTLLRNRYHRRLFLFLAAFLVVLTLQRSLGVAIDAPTRAVFLDGALVGLGMCVTGAIFFARWMALLAGIIAAALTAGLLIPGLFPAGMIVTGPLFFVTLGYFWRRDARRS